MAQLVKNLPAMCETWFHPWDGKVPWRRERLPTSVSWPREFNGLYTVHEVPKRHDRATFTFILMNHDVLFLKKFTCFNWRIIAVFWWFLPYTVWFSHRLYMVRSVLKPLPPSSPPYLSRLSQRAGFGCPVSQCFIYNS